MAAMSNYLEKKLGEHILRGTSSTAPSALFLALCTGAPGETNTPANECSYTGYARVGMGAIATAFGLINDGATTDGLCSNTNAITFGANADAGSVTVSHWVICDAASGGNTLYWGAFDVAKAITQNDIPFVAAGDIVIEHA